MQVTQIRGHYEHVAKISGERFNIFKILEMSTKEVKLHSAFIAELLNPEGSHGQNDIFLKLFVKQLQTHHPDKFVFEESHASVKIEHPIGEKTEDSGGRIDILITNRKKQGIIIENKIYAADQDNQLIRYKEYSNRNGYSSIPLIYLTLEGKDAAENSKQDLKLDEDYVLISYKEDIIDWLTECRKEAATQPMLRETISQYINVVKYLTNQTIDDAMNETIMNEITSSKSNLESFFKLKQIDVKPSLIIKLKEQFEELAKKLDLLVEYNIEFGKTESFVRFSNTQMHSYKIEFSFCGNNTGFVYGIYKEDKKYTKQDQQLVKEKIGIDSLSDFPNEYLWIQDVTEYSDWTLDYPWISIFDGSLIENLEEKIKELLTAIGKLE
jgi:hypothetical protein